MSPLLAIGMPGRDNGLKCKVMKKCMIFLAAALTFAACNDEKGGETPGESIQITGGATEQVVYADETGAGDGGSVTFTTTGPWHAEVVDASEGRATRSVEWVRLSQESGDAAGEYTIEITLAVNTTGRDRKAEIRITCGETVITITVEQRGTTEAGKPVRLVSAIEYEPRYCEAEMNPGDEARDIVLGYDEMGRVVLLRETVHEESGDRVLESALDRGTRGMIRVTDREDNGWSETYTLTLNEEGQVARAEREESGMRLVYDFAYEEGWLREVAWESYGTRYRNTYEYAGGVLSAIRMYSDETRVDSVKQVEEGFGERANDLLNIDPNALFVAMDSYGTSDCFNGSNQTFMGRFDRCALLGLVGNRSERMVEMNDLGDWDLASPAAVYMTPGVIVEEERVYSRGSLDPRLVYSFDEDGYVVSISQSEEVEKVRVTWRVQVSHELMDPGVPEHGYQWEEIEGSRQESTLESGTNRYVYTFRYE